MQLFVFSLVSDQGEKFSLVSYSTVALYDLKLILLRGFS